LRGEEGFRTPLPPAELARQNSAKKQRRTELTGSDQTWSQHDRSCLVSGSSSQVWDARALHWRVRSSPKEATKHARSIGRGSASGHDRPDASGREWVLTRNDRTLALWRPLCQACVSGHGLHVRGGCVTGASSLCRWRVQLIS
jgi:hypothetical protein